MLAHLPVQEYACETYGQLFEVLLQQRGVLCCGLYRQAQSEGRYLRYVYANPHKVCVLVTQCHCGAGVATGSLGVSSITLDTVSSMSTALSITSHPSEGTV